MAKVERVKGQGVVGEQPVLPPGGLFEYTSYCPLKAAGRIDAGQLSDGHEPAASASTRHRAVHTRRSQRTQ
jgi:uncharacterized protein affecting Mg2+/Co2+ transport